MAEHNPKPATSDKENGWLETRFRYTVENVSKLDAVRDAPSKNMIHSHPFSFRKMHWKLNLQATHWRSYNTLHSTEYTVRRGLGTYLQIEKPESKASCHCEAVLDITLLSVKEGVENKTTKIIRDFDSKILKGSGISRFADYDYVTDPSNGYIKDDCITFEVHLNAGPHWSFRKNNRPTRLVQEKRTKDLSSPEVIKDSVEKESRRDALEDNQRKTTNATTEDSNKNGSIDSIPDSEDSSDAVARSGTCSDCQSRVNVDKSSSDEEFEIISNSGSDSQFEFLDANGGLAKSDTSNCTLM